MKFARAAGFCCALLLPLTAAAEFKILLGFDPADDSGKQDMAFGVAAAPSLSAALGTKVSLNQTTNLTDAMRASRTQENDAIIAPPHVTASAVSHNYQLIARDPKNASYVLVARKEIARIEDIAGKRLYLTQQDSVRAYLAKGLLTEAGFSSKSFKQTVYGKTSGAGLFALASNLADVTVAEQAEAQTWISSHPGVAAILKTSRPVPEGMALMVRKNLAEGDRKKLLKWITSFDTNSSGIGKLQLTTAADEEQYRYIASLGILTPASLSGVQRVTASEVVKLMANGAVAVDTRTPKEYQLAHITGSINAPYVERSLKDRDFDSALDDFSAITALPKDKPTIFFCNGPECWKSYKASKIALANGMKQVYWFRGGEPEWQEQSRPVAGTGSSK
ncbi:PhnD/SsuA/transferrin family substrate-binding protein [Paraherbaspirillum soli]|uniref:PhnD/SsuA/transferrin family substrate-binding protein n=1 Tax=Paraherbaspirillum soli TaxID=631222 RepID=A0ABW0MD67_9BURK